MNMPSVYGDTASAPVRHSTLQLHDAERGIVLECRYLRDLQLLQIVMERSIGKRPSVTRPDSLARALLTVQGQVNGMRWLPVNGSEYLVIGGATLQLRPRDAEALRAWLAVEVQS